AQRAGVTRGAVYWHFRNKADLFNATMQPLRLPLDEMVAGLIADTITDPIDQLREAIYPVLERLRTDESYQRLFIIWFHRIENASELEIIAGKQRDTERHREVVLQLFERAQRQGQLRESVTPASAELAIRLLLIGLYTEWLRDTSRFDISVEGRAAVEALLSGLLRCR
ncbi:MAG: TetR family transcriptional regulator, partial [Spongiibacteraceae bacterium]|nr:TetR family transcriptional regulator [Spongiibacteraceae bacterium]